MIGNDIIDLKVASITTRWDDQRFIDKVFSNSEQDLIRKATDPFRTIWIIWSMKESAYKIHVRRYLNRFFAPTQLKCQFVAFGKGLVNIDQDEYITSSIINEYYIYTIAVKNEPGTQRHLRSKCFFVNEASYSSQHAYCYQKIICDLSDSYKAPSQHFSIKKDQQDVPSIYKDGSKLPIPLTITHHGSLGAYAYLKT